MKNADVIAHDPLAPPITADLAKKTGAFNTSQPVPPLHPAQEGATGVRVRPPPAERETLPDRTSPPPAPVTPTGPPAPPESRPSAPSHNGRSHLNGSNGTHLVGVGALLDAQKALDAIGPSTIAELVAAVGGKLTAENVRGLITQECRELEKMLLEKNRKYGNSALEPKRIFSKLSPVEQLYVRIDDKLSRIENTGIAAADEDTLADLQGYITLLRVARRLGLS